MISLQHKITTGSEIISDPQKEETMNGQFAILSQEDIESIIKKVIEGVQNVTHATKPESSTPIFLTSKEVCEKLHISSTTLWRWKRESYIKPVMICNKYFYRASDLNMLSA